MKVYELDYLPGARKSIEKLSRQLQIRILSRLEELKTNPRPHGSIKMTGIDLYRIRVGDYRVIYSIEVNRLIVTVVEVDHRRDVYRKR